MREISDKIKDSVIEALKEGKEIPLKYKDLLFPVQHKECELTYADKIRKEDLLADSDGVFPVPLQIEKVFDGNEYELFDDDWKNMMVFGDNLQFLKAIRENKDPLIKDKVKGKVKLIYIDPPFATAEEFQNKNGARAYSDKRKGAEFVEFLRRRLILAREILADDGSIYIHLDEKMSHYIKIIMDEVFGKKFFKREIIWSLSGVAGYKSLVNSYVRGHEVIYYYSKSDNVIFNKEYLPYNDEQLKRFSKKDHDGRIYKSITETRRHYLDESKGIPVSDVWSDIASFQTVVNSPEIMNYPTQKPEALLQRIVKASTNKGDIVFDFFGGSGTTMSVAEKLGRKWIICDLGKLAYFTMQKRVLQIQNSKDLENPKKKYGKKAKSFVTAQLGSYDLKKALNLDWQEYQRFVSGLFEVEIDAHKIAGVEFEGKKGGHPVRIFDYGKHRDVTIGEEYLQGMHAIIGKKVGSRVYIIAPVNSFDFIANYHEIDSTKYYFLKIPYHVIEELHRAPFQKLRQPQSKKDVNGLEEAVGFHFIRQPEVEAELKDSVDKVTILINSFASQEPESDKAPVDKGKENFEELSAVFIDKDYNGKAFEMDEAFFADELLYKNGNIEISLKKTDLGKQIMVVCTDIYGNDSTKIFKI